MPPEVPAQRIEVSVLDSLAVPVSSWALLWALSAKAAGEVGRRPRVALGVLFLPVLRGVSWGAGRLGSTDLLRVYSGPWSGERGLTDH